MANTSILAAFERMWQHVVAALGNKADTGHGHNVVSTSADGFAPKRDGSTTKFLRADGTWAVPSSGGNTATYGVATSSTLGLVKSGTDITVDSSGNVSVKDDSHNHVISNIDNLQSSLDAKQATITGGATTITGSNLTTNRALISNGSGKVAVSDVTSTELGYLDGVTSNIQTQLNAKVPTSRTVNGKALSSNITISASDISAYTKSEIDAMTNVFEKGDIVGQNSKTFTLPDRFAGILTVGRADKGFFAVYFLDYYYTISTLTITGSPGNYYNVTRNNNTLTISVTDTTSVAYMLMGK